MEHRLFRGDAGNFSGAVYLFAIIAGLAGLFFLSLVLGSSGFLLPWDLSATQKTLFWEIRLPRTLAALLAGGILAVSGASYQGVFQNPLVSPDLLGASAGSVIGIMLGLICGAGFWLIPLISFSAGMLAMLLVISLAFLITRSGGFSAVLLILVGVVLSALFSAVLNFLRYFLPDESSMFGASYYMMGALNGVSMQDMLILTVFGLVPVLGLCVLSRSLDVLTLPHEVLETQGVRVKALIFIILFLATMASSATVAVGGIIAWVSLIVPGILRFSFGRNHVFLLPCAFFTGAAFLLLCDLLSRTLISHEIPIGIMTSIVGVPFFLGLLYLTRRKYVQTGV